jgi:hypothetical protein
MRRIHSERCLVTPDENPGKLHGERIIAEIFKIACKLWNYIQKLHVQNDDKLHIHQFGTATF